MQFSDYTGSPCILTMDTSQVQLITIISLSYIITYSQIDVIRIKMLVRGFDKRLFYLTYHCTLLIVVEM